MAHALNSNTRGAETGGSLSGSAWSQAQDSKGYYIVRPCLQKNQETEQNKTTYSLQLVTVGWVGQEGAFCYMEEVHTDGSPGPHSRLFSSVLNEMLC